MHAMCHLIHCSLLFPVKDKERFSPDAAARFNCFYKYQSDKANANVLASISSSY